MKMTMRTIFSLLTFACIAASSSDVMSREEVSLFDGKTLHGWTTLDEKPITSGWKVVDGMIRLDPSKGRSGHIITTKEFGDFSLSYEWKIARGGNSGLKYRVRNYSGKWYGCEYQMLDDSGHHQGTSPRQSTGALYGLYEPSKEKRVLPAGEFNSTKIVVHDNKIQHWLNGRQILAATVGDDDWRKRVADSKFNDLKDFSQNRRGRIMLTDHGSEVWFRNFEFKPLP